MLPKWLVLSGLVPAVLLAGFLAGCRRESVADREEFAGVMTSTDGRGFIPIKLPERKGDSILGAVTAGGDQPREQRSDAVEQAAIDDSSAEAIGQSLVEMAASNDWTHLADLLVDDQADAVHDLIHDLGPFTAAVGEFNRAVEERFDAHAVVIEMREFWLEQLAALANQLSFEVQAADDDEATVVFVAGHPDAIQPRRVELIARRTEDGWRLMFPDFQPTPDPSRLELDRKAEAFRDLTNRVRNDDVRDAAEAEAEVDKVIAGTYALGAEAQDGRTDYDQPAPQPRQRDAVDDVYSGPGMLRGR
jgi:hypothetical protein